MSYQYEAGDEDFEAPDIEGVDGACPPLTIRYRIYPSADFNGIFAEPPASVDT